MDNKILTARQVAEMLVISKAKIYLMAERREIPYIRIGKNIRFWEKDIVLWLQELTVPAKV